VVAGIAVGTLFHGYVHESWVTEHPGRKDNCLVVPGAVLLGVPLYPNATGLIPVAEAMLGTGAAIVTTLAFMMSIAALSLPEMIILRRVIKWLALYAGLLAIVFMLAGWGRNFFTHQLKERTMKRLLMMLAAGFILTVHTPLQAAEQGLDKFMTSFDYATRKDMKIASKALIPLLKAGKAQLVDIRFKEENATWKVNPSLSIPLNELPRRLNEIDTSKIVVTACPHKDRATIAMVYLRAQGINAKYLTDGLTGLVENLRGDAAKDLVEALAIEK
jgi:rhodanese-related sulfurtransferase